MNEPVVLHDRISSRFSTALERAYDINDVLAAFWCFATPLAAFELRASGVNPFVVTASGVQASATANAYHALSAIDAASFQRGGLLANESAGIPTLATEFEKNGWCLTAEALMRFNVVARSLAEDPPESSWCQHTVEQVLCEQCSFSGRYLFWQVVNTKKRPDLRAAACSGQLQNEARCYVCEALLRQSHFFYCDPGREEFLVVWPYGPEFDSEEIIKMYCGFLAEMPLEMRDRKDRIVSVSGMPIAVFQEPNVAAITLCTPSEFIEVVTDHLYFNVEPWTVLQGNDDYWAANKFVEEAKWELAAGAFARSVLKDPVRVSFLRNISSCLFNAQRNAEATKLLQETQRLEGILLKKSIIKRVVRKSVPGGSRGEATYCDILQHGLPPDWGFADMLAQLRSIAEMRAE
ncbi:MAG: CpXC domain-containing protein [Xanthobacteraceae bacterium]|jgi:hypothetical protein